ncbi:MAG: winged helix-turn-helix domain-containing protein [Steroidobacteraceae bacterium]
MDQTSTPDYEFGGFRLDTALEVLVAPSGELVPLPSRAFETLRCLVERAGELIERPALMKAVWPRSVVEENNLSQCILTLRRALGESAGERRFILTVPGRGFKFVAPVRVVSCMRSPPGPPRVSGAAERSATVPATESVPANQLTVTASVRAGWTHAWYARRTPWILLAAVLGLALAGPIWLLRRGAHSPAVTSPDEYQALTDVSDSATAPALSPDGRMLAFLRGGKAFVDNAQLWLKLLPDGEPVQLTRVPGSVFAPAFTPDGTHIVYTLVDVRAQSWDTWSVPITGGEPTLFLPNASGLSFIGPHEVMYSEFKTGVHLGIVTSLDDRSHHRDIYLPEHERGMAHFSYLSPDRRSVIVVEMDGTGTFQRCRLVPFDARSAGRPVGPAGQCRSAAWSVTGHWMYFAVQIGERSHLWQERFPDGAPEQITFGPTDEDTVAAAPDGHSLLTGLGLEQSVVWIHDSSGERSVSTEGHAYRPWLAPDARHVYFLSARSAGDPAKLWRVDVASGRREPLLAGFGVSSFDISPDERQVIFTTRRDGSSEIWIAPLDRDAAPRLLLRGGDEPAFDRGAHVFFRRLGAHANYLYRMNADGSGEMRVLATPIVEFNAVAPDGKWVNVHMALPGAIAAGWLIPVDGTSPERRRVGNGWAASRWSPDGKLLYVDVGAGGDPARYGRTLALPLGTDGLPIPSADLGVPHMKLIPHAVDSLSVGNDPSVYAFVQQDDHRNIYRIPLHN